MQGSGGWRGLEGHRKGQVAPEKMFQSQVIEEALKGRQAGLTLKCDGSHRWL